MAGFTVGNTNIFTSNTFSGTFNGFTSTNQLVFSDEGTAFYQGESFGYHTGGKISPPGTYSNQIQRFSLSSDTNATDSADLSETKIQVSGQSSSTDGYASGGYTPAFARKDTIDKFPFASETNAVAQTGTLTQARQLPASSSSLVSGYVNGGLLGPPGTTNVVDKFPFSTDTNASDVGDLTIARRSVAGHTSITDGYSSGGDTGSIKTSQIDKFPFASDANATGVGHLAENVRAASGQSSDTNGYSSGGSDPAVDVSTIQKFSFSNQFVSFISGELSAIRTSSTGVSSTTDGYSVGGSSGGYVNIIERFPFSTDNSLTDVGDLFTAIQDGPSVGQQV